MKLKEKYHIPFLILYGALLFLPFLGAVNLFDWDEINFAEAAREMLLTRDYLRVQINFQPFWQKPPVFIWLQALSMQLFGINEFAARFPNAICGIASILSLYVVGKKWINTKFGLLWAIVYAGTILPFLYFKSGIIDPWFNLYIFLGIVFLIRAIKREGNANISMMFSGIFIGLATLTKGPVGILLPALTYILYSLINFGKPNIKLKEFLIGTVSVFLVCSLWFGADIIQNGWWFTKEFISYQIQLFTTEDAGHGGPIYYHVLVLLFGCFPASVFLIDYFANEEKRLYQDVQDKMLFYLLIIVVVLFSIVKTKIVHYSSLAYFPIAYFAALSIAKGLDFKKVTIALFAALSTILSFVFLLVPIAGNNLDKIASRITDPFAVANLNANVHWSYFELIIGLLFLGLAIWTLLRMIKKEQFAMILFPGLSIILFLITMLWVPKIEAYSQRAAIEFFEQHADEDVHIQTIGYKSYGQYFYGKVDPEIGTADLNEMLTEQSEYPAYFVTKNNKAAEIETKYQLQRVGEKNGFVFLKKN